MYCIVCVCLWPPCFVKTKVPGALGKEGVIPGVNDPIGNRIMLFDSG